MSRLHRNPSIILALGLIAAGCAGRTLPVPVEANVSVEPLAAAGSASIAYETGPCFGFCPVYRLTIDASGKGVFTGIRNTQVSGDRAFIASADQLAAFRAALAPYRPSGERVIAPQKPDCVRFATDAPSVTVTWSEPSAAPDRLSYNFGCRDAGNAALSDAVGNAPDLLPIVDLIGELP